jgi:hypothetical protein
MSRRRRRDNDPPLPRLVFGVAVVAVGAIVYMHRLRGTDLALLNWWPLAVIAVGLAQLPYRKWVAAAVWMAGGAWFLMVTVKGSQVYINGILGLWPLMISFAGVLLIMQSVRPGERSFSATAVMAGNVRKVAAQFVGGEVVAVMGGCDLDFTAATISGEAVLDVLAFWGGIGVSVPRGWSVESRVTPILGGYDDKTSRPAAPGAPRLIIRGSAIMGGIEVRNPKENGD